MSKRQFSAPDTGSQTASGANGVMKGAGTILSGQGVAKVAFMKRLLPRKTFRKLLIEASRKMGYLPEK